MGKKRASKKNVTDKSDKESSKDGLEESPEERFLDALQREGIANVQEFRDEILRVFTGDESQPITVANLFKFFRPHSLQHEFLMSLREKHIARPEGGGGWRVDRPIVLTKKGLELARSCNLKTRQLVFVSYSRKDQIWRDRLVEHLSVLEQGFQLDLWFDQRVGIGGDWFAEIKDALERSTAAVLLISASFLSSEFIKHKEVPRILDRIEEGFRVFPVLVRPCAWQTVDWLRKLQIRPNDGKALASDSESQVDGHLAEITLEISELLGAS